MNNEEKILEMLTEMRSDIAELKADVSGLKATQAEQGELLKELDARSLKSAVLLETEVARGIQTALEGHSELRREIGTLATKEQMEKLSSDVEVIKDVVRRHSGDINKLKKAQ